MRSVPASVIDIFCGAGGLTHGFKLEGFQIACGVDVEESCRYAFEKNNEATFIHSDVKKISGKKLLEKYSKFKNHKRILVGCAPCQAFSLYNQKRKNDSWKLVKEFGRLVRETQADVISMENVPQMAKFQDEKILNDFLDILKKDDYNIWWDLIYCPDYGVPQSRKRFVLLASKLGKIKIIPPLYSKANYITVSDAIKKLPKLQCGEVSQNDTLHRCSNLTKINKMRIEQSIPDGTWKDWNYLLRSPCHKKHSGIGYSNVYGRMSWGKPAPTITTRFFGYANGRFGHPEQNRAISLREGALLQSFPKDYVFSESHKVNFGKIGRMIGNAVPVRLSQAIARTIKQHLKEFENG